MVTVTALTRETNRDRVTFVDVAGVPDSELEDRAREEVLYSTRYPSRDLGANVTRYPLSDTAVVTLWKD